MLAVIGIGNQEGRSIKSKKGRDGIDTTRHGYGHGTTNTNQKTKTGHKKNHWTCFGFGLKFRCRCQFDANEQDGTRSRLNGNDGWMNLL